MNDNEKKRTKVRVKASNVPLSGRMNEERLQALTLPAMPEIGVEAIQPIELLALLHSQGRRRGS